MKSIREVLSPLLIISYVLGLRLWIIELSIAHLRSWFGISYMLSFWLIYYIIFETKIISHINDDIHYSTEFLISFWIDIFITLLTIVFGTYYNKKCRNCLKKLDIVDDTLLKIGITTDYHKLHKKSMLLILGWFITVILITWGMALWMNIAFNFSILTTLYIHFMRNYFTYINIIDDLIIASLLGYVGLKFDQVNGYLVNISKDNKYDVKQTQENPVLLSYQHTFPKTPNKEWMTWILMHLHLELRRISYEINSIFGIQMTIKMGCIFFWLTLDLREIFSVILINNYIRCNRILYIIIIAFWIIQNIAKLFLINYMCETVSAKANATRNLINRMQYSTYNVEIRENISQFLLQMAQIPVKFYGIGLFQFGYKFLQKFSVLITSVVVLLMQTYVNKLAF
ncbi:uncharacterized protein LOC114931995 [Nylanderia fulva]|uniref:uncharacterized protein LOC114931995 n=1 Tax=Nylanderia fulva TaxID=613905 RepID=UPI0010FBA6F3|nr:uncharacterized protein LOC114931995 [Nylanderia fulva]